MKRVRTFEIEAVDPAHTAPWRLIVEVLPDRTNFNLHWGYKPLPTHSFSVNAKDWKEITE